MASLIDRLIKNSTIKETAILPDSKIFGTKDVVPTSVPMINVLLSGKIDGGLTSGLTVIAGPSKHFKTSFALMLAAAFVAKYPEGVILFYDSEFGTPDSYVKSFKINPNQIVHSPITNLEVLKFDIAKQLEELDRKDRVLILVDSIGNLASKKELDDAMKQSGAADMTRAKQMKSLFRMITPILTIKDIPMIAINHTYKTQDMFPKDVVSGGTGVMYSSDNVWIVGRAQDKSGTELQGYFFNITVEKSRFVKEKSKIPISVTWDAGIQKWSGFLDIALEGNYVAKPKNGWYCMVDRETGELKEPNFRESAIAQNGDIWKMLLATTDLGAYIEKKYSLPTNQLMIDREETLDDPEFAEAEEEI